MVGYPVKERTGTLQSLVAGQRVLHLGCTNWPYTRQTLDDGTLLHALLHPFAHSMVGLDADRAGIEQLEAAGLGPIVLGDAERLNALRDDPALSTPFDVIVAAEIIEHLSNPGQMLEGVRSFLAPDGRLVLTTINAYGAVRITPYALRGRGGTAEPVHPDHVAYYSPSTLQVLLTRAGYEVDWLAFYRLGDEHRPHCSWWIRWANDVATRLAPQLSDGLIVVCRPRRMA